MQRLRVKTENVVHEEVDGEVIAIDLAGGSYYSLSGGAPAIWSLLSAGADEDEVCAAIASAYDVEAESVRESVATLLAELTRHGLVAPIDERAGDAPALPAVGGAFPAPVFERYDDMKDYFLLDPIHEVDPSGWPKPAA